MIKHKHASGLSLIELMVAISLGLLLTLGILYLFNTSKVTFNTNEALARVQENGRFAVEVLKRDIRDAGTHGFCSGRLPITTHLDVCSIGINSIFDPVRTLGGWEFDGTGNGDEYTLGDAGGWSSSINGVTTLPGYLAGRVAAGSDVLLIRKLEVLPGLTGTDPSATGASDATMDLNSAHGLRENSLVLVTDCSFSDLFHNTTAPTADEFSKSGGSCSSVGPGNRTSAIDWSVFHSDGLQMFEVQIFAYYIGTDADGEPGLYRLDLSRGISGAEEAELVRGAETFQVLYGFSSAAPAGDGESIDFWVTADDVPADGWDQVLAVWVGLSVVSEDRADGDNSNVTFTDLVGVPGTGVDIEIPGDGSLRQPFSATIALRNQLLVIDD